MNHRQLAFYCDFDGTIAEQDMIGAIMKEFAREKGQVIVNQVNAKQLSVKDGVEALFALIPSDEYTRMQQFAVEHTKIRPGFSEFVAKCRDRGWRLNVVSGGFDFFVLPVVEPYQDVIQPYCNSLDTSGPNLRVLWSVPCDAHCEGGCGLCKPTVIRQTADQNDTLVVIGDGVTDVKQAKLADFTFARDRLLAECAALSLPHAAFETFYDIAEHPFLR